jgi:hypothetical protein
VSGYTEIARALEHVAAWIDKELAAGTPPKWVARQASAADREIAAMAREADARPVSTRRRAQHRPAT